MPLASPPLKRLFERILLTITPIHNPAPGSYRDRSRILPHLQAVSHRIVVGAIVPQDAALLVGRNGKF